MYKKFLLSPRPVVVYNLESSDDSDNQFVSPDQSKESKKLKLTKGIANLSKFTKTEHCTEEIQVNLPTPDAFGSCHILAKESDSSTDDSESDSTSDSSVNNI